MDNEKRNLQIIIREGTEEDYNGLVYDPTKIFTSFDGTCWDFCEVFFKPRGLYQMVVVETLLNPLELACLLKNNFDVHIGIRNSVTFTLFKASEEQASALLTDLYANPQDYFQKPLLEIFAHGKTTAERELMRKQMENVGVNPY